MPLIKPILLNIELAHHYFKFRLRSCLLVKL